MISELTNHLWQSTLFAVVAAVLTVVFRKNLAQIRYGLWLSASLKFLVPFSLLATLGTHLAPPTWKMAKQVAVPAVSLAIEEIAQPFPDSPSFVPAPRRDGNWIIVIPVIFGVWLCGFVVIAVIRFRGWLHIRSAVRSSTPLKIPLAVKVRSCSGLLEPGVVGFDVAGFSPPILLLPVGIIERLTPTQLEAVLAHELTHVQRRDNLTAAMHMIVEAVFWFHPLVWWIGARLVEERERACDEEVLRLGNEARVYAESILKVCQFYIESPLACFSGVTGSDLKKRVARITQNQLGEALSTWKRRLLAAAGAAALGVPLVAGALAAPRQDARSLESMEAAGIKMSFDVASVKPNKTNDRATRNVPLTPDDIYALTGGLFSATATPLRDYILFAYRVLPMGLPGWVNTDRFDIEARAQGNPTKDQYRLMMQSLLADRFKLATHFEAQQVPVYALAVAKEGTLGPQLKRDDGPCSTTITAADVQARNTASPLPAPSAGSQPPQIACGTVLQVPPILPGRVRVAGTKVTMALLAKLMASPLSGLTDRLPVDRTGLSGTFDVSIEWTPPITLPGFTPDPNGPTFIQAVQDQLGLKLEPTMGPVNVLVIDHIEEPSAN